MTENLALVSAVANGDLDLVRRLEIDANERDSAGRPLLVIATWTNNLEMCSYLASAGANVDVRDKKGKSSLHLACFKNFTSIVSFLVDRRADVDLVDEDGNSAAHHAAIRKNFESLVLLGSAGANFALENRAGRTVIDIAREQKAGDCLFYLESFRVCAAQDGVSLLSLVSHYCRLAVEYRDSKQRLEQCHVSRATLAQLQKETNLRETHLRRQLERSETERNELRAELAEKDDTIASLQSRLEILEDEKSSLAADKENDESAYYAIESKDVEIDRQCELGRGSFAVVNLGTWQGSRVAVKTLHDEVASLYNGEVVKQETSNCSRLRHPHVVAMCGWIAPNVDEPPSQIVFELLEASLTDVITAALNSPSYLTLREQIDLARDSLSGLAYLHHFEPALLHGDIRPSNILVTRTMAAKIGDLGSSHFAGSPHSVGPLSRFYLAPERMPNKEGRAPGNTAAADVYSLGVSAIELFTGKPPGVGAVCDENELLVNICVSMTCEEPRCRGKARDVLCKLEDVKRQRRYSACPPKRLVKGVQHGIAVVELTEKRFD